MDDNDDTPQLRPRETTRDLPNVGKFRLLADLEPMEVTFILLAFVSIVGAAIITIVRLNESQQGDADFTFAMLLLLNLVFVLAYTIHGIFCERSFELFVSVIATVIVMLYCIGEYAVKGHLDHGENYDLKLGRLIVVCVLGPVDIILGSIIGIRFYKSKRLIFRTVGGNAALQNMCQTMFAFTAFLKFDLQLVLSLLILVINGGAASLTLSEKLILGIGVPFSVFWLILGFIMVRFELIRYSTIFWVLGLAEPAYIIYLFVMSGGRIDSSNVETTLLDVCIIAGGTVALVVRIILMLLSYLITKNFNKGLKEKVYGTTEILSAENPDYESTRTRNER